MRRTVYFFKCEECSRKFAKIYTHCKDHIKTCEKCGYTTSYKKRFKESPKQLELYARNIEENMNMNCPILTGSFISAIIVALVSQRYITSKSIRKHTAR